MQGDQISSSFIVKFETIKTNISTHIYMALNGSNYLIPNIVCLANFLDQA